MAEALVCHEFCEFRLVFKMLEQTGLISLQQKMDEAMMSVMQNLFITTAERCCM